MKKEKHMNILLENTVTKDTCVLAVTSGFALEPTNMVIHIGGVAYVLNKREPVTKEEVNELGTRFITNIFPIIKQKSPTLIDLIKDSNFDQASVVLKSYLTDEYAPLLKHSQAEYIVREFLSGYASYHTAMCKHEREQCELVEACRGKPMVSALLTDAIYAFQSPEYADDIVDVVRYLLKAHMYQFTEINILVDAILVPLMPKANSTDTEMPLLERIESESDVPTAQDYALFERIAPSVLERLRFLETEFAAYSLETKEINTTPTPYIEDLAALYAPLKPIYDRAKLNTPLQQHPVCKTYAEYVRIIIPVEVLRTMYTTIREKTMCLLTHISLSLYNPALTAQQRDAAEVALAHYGNAYILGTLKPDATDETVSIAYIWLCRHTDDTPPTVPN